MQFALRREVTLILELPLADGDAYWVAELRREQLLDVVHERNYPLRSARRFELADLRPPHGQLLAVWKAKSAADRTLLPQVIVAEPPALGDLLAWSATYLRGLGPLTAQTRVLTPAQLRAALRQRPEGIWWSLAGGAVGLVIGEVLAYAGQAIPLTDIGLAACRGSLSFVLMRAAALGATSNEFDELADLWAQLRSETGQARTQVPPRSISNVAMSLAHTTLHHSSKGGDPDPTTHWLRSLFAHGPTSQVLEKVLEVFGLPQDHGDLNTFGQSTAEERVKMFDRIVPQLIR
jgi:hypothetical protein